MMSFKIKLTLGTFLLVFQILAAQDTFFQEASKEVESASRILVEKYTPELVLSGNQLLSFEAKITEFLMRKSEVDQISGLNTREKLAMLKKISKQETAEMANILTGPQLRRYRKIKKKLQPIYVVIDD